MKERLSRFMVIVGLCTVLFGVTLGIALGNAFAGDAGKEGSDVATAAAPRSPLRDPMIVVGVAVAITGSCLGAGYAVGKVGAAAFGAISERPELITRALLFVALAEGIAIWGFVIAMMLLMKL